MTAVIFCPHLGPHLGPHQVLTSSSPGPHLGPHLGPHQVLTLNPKKNLEEVAHQNPKPETLKP